MCVKVCEKREQDDTAENKRYTPAPAADVRELAVGKRKTELAQWLANIDSPPRIWCRRSAAGTAALCSRFSRRPRVMLNRNLNAWV